MNKSKYTCYLCGSINHRILEVITKKPEGEVDYGIVPEQYHRVVTQCQNCHVYTNQHDLLRQEMYAGDYNQSISESDVQASISQRYDKVMSLPIDQSDNRGRVARIGAYFDNIGKDLSQSDILDVGSGTCVFLGAIKGQVRSTACIDPDAQAVSHAINYVGVDMAHTGTLADFGSSPLFDIITFNKVLEHVLEPVAILKQASRLLKDGGIIYVELPEGDRTATHGNIAQRQEFFVEHYTIFNEPSYLALCQRAGYQCQAVNIITEASGKLSIYGFLTQQK